MHPGRAVASRDGALEPDNLSPTMVKVGCSAERPSRSATCLRHRRTGAGTGPTTSSRAAVLKVRPVDTARGAVTGFRDYRLASTVALTNLVSTAYTVLR